MYQIAKNKVDSQHVCAKASGMPVHYKTKRPADRSADTASRPGKRAASGAAVQPAAEKTAGAPRTGTVRDTIHFGIQRKIVANMTSESWRTIPHCTYVYEADVTSFLQACRRRNARHAQHATLNTILLKVICEGLKAAPILNAHLTFQRRLVRGRIDTFENIDISMPMILPGGEMMTVKLPDCGSKSLDELTQAVGDIRRRAENTDFSQAMYDVSLQNTLNGLKHGRVLQAAFRLLGSKTGRHRVRTLHGGAKRAYMAVPESERLTAEDLEQGTVTVSNLGSVYRAQTGQCTLLEIIPPQVAAFAIGAVQERPSVVHWADGTKEIGVRSILPITIAFDHRVCDFGDVAPFLKRLDEIFAAPSVVESW